MSASTDMVKTSLDRDWGVLTATSQTRYKYDTRITVIQQLSTPNEGVSGSLKGKVASDGTRGEARCQDESDCPGEGNTRTVQAVQAAQEPPLVG